MQKKCPVVLFAIALHLGLWQPVTAQAVRENLGIYGGTVLSYGYDDVHKKLFAAVAGPLSLFVSSDTGTTWEQAFPDDSLEVMSGNDRFGWGGRGMKVVSDGGVTVVLTSEEGGTLHSCVLSTDGGTWQTLFDERTSRKLQDSAHAHGAELKPAGSVQTAAVYQGIIYLASGDVIYTSSDTGKTWSITGFPDSTVLAASNQNTQYTVATIEPLDATGTNYYVIASEPNSQNRDAGNCYRTTDGITFTALLDTNDTSKTKPTSFGVFYADKVGSDTLFGFSDGNGPKAIWRSFDAGTTWEQVIAESPGSNLGGLVVCQDTVNPGPHHLRLISGVRYSDDLGTTWIQFPGVSVGEIQNGIQYVALQIPNSDIFIGYRADGPCIATGGLTGIFTLKNKGLASLTIYQVEQRPEELNRVYLATASGIAYTTKYLDTTISNAEKWTPPYGNFPVQPDLGMTFQSIKINPYDSMKVIAASGNGIYRTVNGGMSANDWTCTATYEQVTGLDANTVKGNGGRLMELAFLSSDTVFGAIRADRSSYGALIQSFDGGATWSRNTAVPTKPVNVVTVAVDVSGVKVIYVGTGKGEVDGMIYRSRDGGATWDSIVGPDAANSSRKQLAVRDIKNRSGSADTIYIASGDNTDWNISYSFNGGDSIRSFSGQAGGAEVSAIAINKNNPDSIFFAQRNAILLLDFTNADSLKNGMDAQLFRFMAGLPGEIFYDLHYDELMLTSSIGFFSIEGGEQVGVISRDFTAGSADRQPVISGMYRGNRLQSIAYTVEADGMVRVSVYNLAGKLVCVPVNGIRKRGTYTISLQSMRITQGTYLVRISTDKFCRLTAVRSVK